MKKISLIVSVFLFSVSANASACEKWKSEIAGAVKDISLYMLSYKDFHNNAISEGGFTDKSNKIIGKLRDIKARAETVPSCTDDIKFENRRTALLYALNIALPVMTGGKYLAPTVKEKLKMHEE